MTVIKNIHLIGLAADRPAAAPTNEGYYFTETDTAGGTTYRSNGTTWVAIAAGASVTSGVSAHSALSGLTSGDDHTQYQKESERGVANGYASLDSGILVPVAQIPSLDLLTPPAADLSINSHKLTNVSDPTTAQDAATKAYVDSLLNGLVWKASVRAASTANGTLATAYENGDVLDGVTLATGDRILLKNQTTGADNGIYVVAASGAPTRAADADSAAELLQAAVFVREGTANADTGWVLTTNGPLTLGTTALTFSQFNGGGGSSLTVREIDGTPSMTATVIEVTNAKLTDMGSGVARLDLAGGGGGGATISDGAYSTRPAGAEGDLNLPSDGYEIARKGVSAWETWGPLLPMTPPPLVATWTWVNQGGATAVDEKGGIYIDAPFSAANNVRALVRSAPATPWTLIACFYMIAPNVANNTIGILFRQSSDGRLAVWGATNGDALIGGKYNTATSYSANYGTFNPAYTGQPIWLKIADNGTNRICSWSPDGQHWVDFHTVGRTDWLTADQVGFYAEAANGTYGPKGNLRSWLVG